MNKRPKHSSPARRSKPRTPAVRAPEPRAARPQARSRPEPEAAGGPPTDFSFPPSITPLSTTPEFLAAAESLGIQFDPGDTQRLGLYLALLLHANNTCNLTAITDPAEAWMKHILDSLTLLPMLADLAPATDGAQPRIIDIGSGGGVPGLPLAIVLPTHHFTLLEATGKKTDFLRAAAAALELPNITVFQGRAEELGQEHKTHRERYDAATARALGHLAVIAELAAPLVRPGGVILAIKGAKADAEVTEASKAMGLVGARHVTTAQTPTGRIVVLEKTTRTPRSYPRRNGEPKRAPLGLAK